MQQLEARTRPPANVDVRALDNSVLSKSVNLSAEGRFEESEALLEPWLRVGFPAAIFNKGWHVLRRTGDLQAGRMFDAGRQLGCFGGQPLKGPEWTGSEPLEGRRLLVWLEGGLGDQIVGSRFLAPLEARGAQVVAACSEPLHDLFRCLPVPLVHRVAAQQRLVAYDLWTPAMSLAWRMGYTAETLPKAGLSPTSEAVERWRGALGERTGKLRVGVRWRGAEEPAVERDFPVAAFFEQLEPLRDRVEFFSLQLGDEAKDRPSWMRDYSAWMTTMNETGALMQGLDLVVSNCTSVAHLAAATGIETWIVVPIMCYYLWLVPWGGEKSAYYEKVTLFRQQRYDDWSEPLERLGARLRERVG